MQTTTQPVSIQRSLPAAVAMSDDDRVAPADFAWRVLEEIDYGVILVSPGGRLQHANHLGRQELCSGRLLRVRENLVLGSSPQQTAEIMKCVGLASRGRRQMLTLRNGDLSLAVTCVPLFQQRDDECSSVLLILARQTGTQNLNVTFFSRSFGLTSTEEAVLRALCEGREVHEIAKDKQVSECTIRTHVRSMRGKTGLNSIRLLVQHVAALPPVAPLSLMVPPPQAFHLAS